LTTLCIGSWNRFTLWLHCVLGVGIGLHFDYTVHCELDVCRSALKSKYNIAVQTVSIVTSHTYVGKTKVELIYNNQTKHNSLYIQSPLFLILRW